MWKERIGFLNHLLTCNRVKQKDREGSRYKTQHIHQPNFYSKISIADCVHVKINPGINGYIQMNKI